MNHRKRNQSAVKKSLTADVLVFLRAQFTALIATASDFIVTVIMKEIIGLWYVSAVALGAASGAVIAFILNRNWVFIAKHGAIQGQILRYIFVAAISLVLNTAGVYLMTENTQLSYLYSKLFVSISIGLTFNYILARRFVFAR